MIPTELIERALALTAKPRTYCHAWDYPTTFSIDKFFAYILSPSFIDKYRNMVNIDMYHPEVHITNFGLSIYAYQQGNEQPLISLLSKI